MKKIDLSTVVVEDQANYPPPFDEPCKGQMCQRLGRLLRFSEAAIANFQSET